MPHDTFKDIALVLSLRDDQVWASWPDDRVAIRMGEHDAVLAVMRDFIRQSELGERLTRNDRAGGHT